MDHIATTTATTTTVTTTTMNDGYGSPSSSSSCLLKSHSPDLRKLDNTMMILPPLLAATRHLYDPTTGRISGRDVANVIRAHFNTIASAIPQTDQPCIWDPNPKIASLSHWQIYQFLSSSSSSSLSLSSSSPTTTTSLVDGTTVFSPRGTRVAVLLPNAPILALCIVAVAHRAICIPMNPAAALAELQNDLVAAKVDEMICLDNDDSTHHPHHTTTTSASSTTNPNHHHQDISSVLSQLCETLGIICTKVTPDPHCAGGFRVVRSTHPEPILRPPNQLSDPCLMLFTSGTTGGKKLVVHSVLNVLVASACIALSWDLQPTDTVCNLMPLFHIGGILRQVVAPIVSGGAVICCSTVDPGLFWELLLQNRFTWYYAAPTVHQVLLEERGVHQHGKLRMVANAAGGLLPSLAVKLRDTFQCVVLPSYGMTECMPIASPPAASYQLQKPGTSGVSVGPELGILDLYTEQELPMGTEGAICVRGDPCFSGYVDQDDDASSSFLPSGWFNTGDIGYVDSDGFLYITGRSKEVINRGGEIISPLEVEDAVSQHPGVVACLAFSALHAVLQEVVGIVIVPAVPQQRIDLPSLHEFLSEGRLTAPKWPQCMVFMDALPKSFTNKLLRVQLGKRLSIPELHDTNGSWVERTFEAQCPSPGTPLSVAIPCQRVPVSAKRLEKILASRMLPARVQRHETKVGALVAYVPEGVDRLEVIRIAKDTVHLYEVPSHVCYDRGLPPQPSDAVAAIMQESVQRGPTDSLVLELQEQMQMILRLDCLPAPETNFFNLGGSSMLASQLASRIRKIHRIPFSGAEIFHISSCDDIANAIRERKLLCDGGGSESVTASSYLSSSYKPDFSKTPFESSRLVEEVGYGTLAFQLIPILIVFPIWQLVRFFLFFRCLLYILHNVPGWSNLYKIILTLGLFHTAWTVFTPLLFVLIKWVVIGRYKKGRYPIYSNYYLRWWFCDVIRRMIGRGCWAANSTTLCWYYRMLGATIGKDVHILSSAKIAEYDLVTIGDGAYVEISTVRGFGVDNGCMILGPVDVASFASVGARSVVAPYTGIKDGHHMGPNTSSYECVAATEPSSHHLQYNRAAFKQSSVWARALVFYPIILLVEGFSYIPSLYVLTEMLKLHVRSGEHVQTIGGLLEWLANPKRIPYYIGIRAARLVLAPLFYMFAAILVKRFIIGKFKPGPRDINSDWQLLRFELAAELFRQDKMNAATHLIGRHHELVSVLYRVLGAKVGKRVFWPGAQPTFSGEFDLLEIGNDVVFGSKGLMLCTTLDSCEKIILCAGSNVADSTVVLPGSIIGKNAVLGSNAVCPHNRYLPEESVWFGAKNGEPVRLEKGLDDTTTPINSSDVKVSSLQMVGDESTIRPFGKAAYEGEANYFVLPIPMIIAYTVCVQIFVACFTTAPLLGALHLSAGYFFGWSVIERGYSNYIPMPKVKFFLVVLMFHCLTNFIRLIAWVFIEVVTKRIFIGQRQEGVFNWDSSTYPQCWELYRLLLPIRNAGRMSLLDYICGTPYICKFFELLGCQMGKDCCLYPTGADPYMIESDLITMGDRCVIDDAKVVCHLNTRGNFELARIRLADNVTIRTEARVQCGAIFEEGSMLLEKSLAMTGEIIEPESVWLGAPATRLFSYDTVSSINSRNSADLV